MVALLSIVTFQLFSGVFDTARACYASWKRGRSNPESSRERD